MDKEQARKLYELADRLSKLDVNTLSEEQLAERTAMISRLQEVKQRLDPKCWKGKHKEGTKIKGGVRVNNCVPNESIEEASSPAQQAAIAIAKKKKLKEFAPDAGDGSEEDTLHKYARMWYNGDMATQQQVEKILDRMGWEIGEIESEEGGAFVVRSGDENGNSYIGFAVADLTEGVVEDNNGEYDDEAGMSKSNLHTMSRAVNGLLDTIEDNDNLPEWAQEKIAKAEMMVTSVWDYLLSQKEQGIDPKVTEASQQVDTLVTDALKLMRGPEVNDAVRALTTVLGNREYNSRRGHYNFYIRQMIDMYNKQGVAEGSDNITAVFSGYGNYMKGRGANVFKHYGITVLDQQYNEDEDIVEYTVSGSKDALDQARAYLERSDQFGGMILKQGVTETKKPSPKLTPVNIKKTDPVSEEINKEAYERLQKVFAFKNYES